MAPRSDLGDDATETSLGVVVPRRQGEQVRQRLLEAGTLRTDLQIVGDGDDLIFPVTGPVDDLETVERAFPVVETGPSDYRELLDLPDDVQRRLPSSFDRIGDLVLFKLPDDLEPYKAMVGEALAEFTSARSVALDHGVEGRWRVRELEVVVGADDLATVHREHGVALHVDPSRAYFSPRLATEHRRVADLVEDGETVVDAFAGVGPFSLVIARHAAPARVVAVEANPDAVELLERNVEEGGADVVEVLEGDAAEILPSLDADRVIMNLPHDAADYLDAARAALDGAGWIHLYEIVEEADVAQRVDALEAEGLTVERRRDVHHYSPTQEMVVFDCREEG